MAEVLEVVSDIALFVGMTQKLGPVATKFLKNKMWISEEFANKEFIKRSITVYEDTLGKSAGTVGKDGVVEIDITAGDVAGHVVAGVLAGLAVGLFDGIVWAIQEGILKGELQKAITALHPLRTATLLANKMTKTAQASIAAIDAMIDALDAKTPTLKADALAAQKNVIVKAVETTIKKSATYDEVVAELKQLDKDSNSMTDEDPEYPAKVDDTV
jgi:predicted transcriptional regulator